MEYKVIKEISLKSIIATGNTKHYIGNDELPKPLKLQIAQYAGDDGFYLFYLGETDEILTDTYHSTLQAAMEQAEWEYHIKSTQWIDILD